MIQHFGYWIECMLQRFGESPASFTIFPGKTRQSPANWRPRLDAVLMWAHCLQCWPNVKPTLGQCFVCAWALISVWARQMHNKRHVLDQWCADIEDSGPTLNQYRRTLGISRAGVCPATVPCLAILWILVVNIIIYLSDVLLSRIIYTWHICLH